MKYSFFFPAIENGKNTLSLGSNKKRWRQDLDRSHPLQSTGQPPALQQTSTTVLGQTEPSSRWGGTKEQNLLPLP